jgi:alkylation response protein AidB-like acyl-CoA dehydrogenase
VLDTERKGELTVDFRFAPEVEEFRHEVRSFLNEAMALEAVTERGDDSDLTGLSEDFEASVLRQAGSRGYLGVSLPADLGGGGRPAAFQAAFNLEVATADAPLIDTAVTLTAQPLVAWGSAGQQAYFLPKLMAGELLTCIAYSEPEAGSDLGNLAMVAEPDGDGFVLSGVKSLVTGSHKAQWCCTIARTTPGVPAKDGLSMFLVDMHSEGLTLHRRRTMNRWTLGEMTFDRVRVGPEGLLGRRDNGWRQLAAAVATEGGGMFHVGMARHVFSILIDYVKDTGEDGYRLADDPLVRDRMAELWIELEVAERLARRFVWTVDDGQDGTVAASMAKVYATELLQRLARTATDIAGTQASVYRPLFGPASSSTVGDGRFSWEYLERVHGTLGGGTNEVKRTIIARAGLGLPRERS